MWVPGLLLLRLPSTRLGPGCFSPGWDTPEGLTFFLTGEGDERLDPYHLLARKLSHSKPKLLPHLRQESWKILPGCVNPGKGTAPKKVAAVPPYRQTT